MDNVEDRFFALKQREKLIKLQVEEKQVAIGELKSERQALIDTRLILIEAIQIVNSHFKEKIENITSSVVQKIFKRDIEIKVEFASQNYGVQTKIRVIENQIELDPTDDMGGSIIEVISLILRLVLREISSVRLRKTIILDEPFNWAGDLIVLIGDILKQFSEDIQFIILTHDNRLEDIADRVYRIEREFNISRVTRVR